MIFPRVRQEKNTLANSQNTRARSSVYRCRGLSFANINATPLKSYVIAGTTSRVKTSATVKTNHLAVVGISFDLSRERESLVNCD